MEVAVRVYRLRLVILQAEGHLRRVGGGKPLALGAPAGLEIDPLNQVLGGHGMAGAAHVHPHLAVLGGHHGEVLFSAGLGGVGAQGFHLLPAAGHGDAAIADELGQVAAAAADTEICHRGSS